MLLRKTSRVLVIASKELALGAVMAWVGAAARRLSRLLLLVLLLRSALEYQLPIASWLTPALPRLPCAARLKSGRRARGRAQTGTQADAIAPTAAGAESRPRDTAAARMALPDEFDEEEDMNEVFLGMEEGEIEGEVLDDLNDGGRSARTAAAGAPAPAPAARRA